MSAKEYIPGDTVFAKLKGYPWWPARVENDKDIPAKILKQKGKSKGLLYTVFFYGSRDYGFFGPDCVRPFDRATVERDLKAKKFKTKDLETAIHQALDPSILKAEEEAEQEEEEEEEEEPEEEEEEEEEEQEKPKRKERKKVEKKKKVVAKKRIKKEDEKRPAKKARLSEATATEDDNDVKKRRKSLSTEQEEENNRSQRESSAMSRKSEEPTVAVGNSSPIELDLFKKTPEYKKVYHIRHKLQKLVYEKKPGEIQKEDFIKISQVVKEIEDASMTFDLLRYTKIGKVVKFACSYDYGDDEYKINQRCQQLMRNWKSLIIPESRITSAEQSEHQTS
ncbi:hypothetical protein MFLAVUS_000047 [Mucor flavus]|uniref:PWWP domain-containing protein n=1 Tax=Mucor flavus TaxID=439312 RepID=A0ABP9YIL0_9FUNG